MALETAVRENRLHVKVEVDDLWYAGHVGGTAPARYYGQAFFVHWVGFVAVMIVLGLVYGALIWPVLSRPLLLVIALMFVAYSGIAFLLSAAARWDWMSLVVVSVAATYLWSRFGESTHPHFSVRWDDGHESIYYPADDASVRHPPARK